ncbi:trypsin-like peptidase domain-containing protein [Streptomyces sp. NPDC020192]|uniref:nSTAND1 domain-containing NTPase n=1 Tax=Streptomyces sp. NPDC020192 TaxID=3365066 RepID=UPI0037AB0242
MTEATTPAIGIADPDALNASIVRIVCTESSDESALDPAGLGVLIADDLALTCAHVVGSALGRAGTPLSDGARVTLDLPLRRDSGIPGPYVTARIELPPQGRGELDLVLLHLDEMLPLAKPAWMVEAGPQHLWEDSARVFGLPDDHADGVWHAAVLRGSQAGGLVQADMVGFGHPVSAGFSGSPVWDQELGGVVGLMAEAEGSGLPVSYMVPTARILEAWPRLRDLAKPLSPFRGLSPFKESDKAVFYGREAEASHLAGDVAQAPWTTLLGPSGCGKSSLVMAGIIPKRRAAGDCVIVIKPERPLSPLRALAAALVPLLEPDLPVSDRPARYNSLVANLAEQGLRDLAPLVLEQQDRQRLLVVVDQFEELLKLDEDDIEAFAQVLSPNQLPERVSVLAVLRADFLGSVLERPSLAPVAETTMQLDETALIQVRTLAPMRAEQVREIIALPLEEIPGIDYEAGLSQRILDDARAEKGILPLLAYTLAELWKLQHGGRLTHAAYDHLGGVKGALKSAASGAWKAIDDDDKPAAEHLLTRLVWIPDGAEPPTCRTATRGELGEAPWRIARGLAAENLLILDSADGSTDETVRLAHDALVTAWDELDRLVANNREFLAWLPTLRSDLTRWKNGAQSPDLLPPDSVIDLVDDKNWQPSLSKEEREFLDLGRAHHRSRRRRRRTVLSGTAMITTLALVLGFLFLYTRGQDMEHSAEANSRTLAQVSQDESASDPALAAMLAVAAYKTSPTREARNQVLREYLAYSAASRVISGLPGSVATFATSRDGNVVFAGTPLGRSVLFVHAASGTVVSEPISARYVVYAVVSPDGHRAGFVDDEGNAGWFDVNADSSQPAGPIHKLPRVAQANFYYNHPADAAAISSDGNLMAAVTGGGTLALWNLKTGTLARLPAPPNTTNSIWFSSDNRSLLVKTDTSNFAAGLSAVTIVTGQIRTVVPAAENQDFLISGNRSIVAVCLYQNNSPDTLSLRRIDDGSTVGQPYHGESACQAVAIDATGRWIAVNEKGSGGVHLIDMHQSRETGLIGTPADTGDSFSDQLISGRDGNLYLAAQGTTDITYTKLPTAASLGPAPADNEALTSHGKYVIDVSQDGSKVQLLSVALGSLVSQAERQKPYWKPASSDTLASSRDGKLLADREGADVVSVRQIPSLRQTALITIPKPISWTSETNFSDFFDADAHLVTVFGTDVQEWDAHTGRMLAQFNATAFHPRSDTNGEPQVTVAPYSAANQVVIIDTGDPLLRVVDLTTGHVITSLKTDDDVISIQFDPSGQYFSLLRAGSQVELWRRDPLAKELGPLPSLTGAGGILDVSAGNPTGQAGPFAAGFIDSDGHFMIGSNGTVHVYKVGDRSYTDYYDFSLPSGIAGQGSSNPYTFLAVAGGGKELLYKDPQGNLSAIELNTAVWEQKLCSVIGDRGFVDADRASLPAGIPQQPVCPASGSS